MYGATYWMVLHYSIISHSTDTRGVMLHPQNGEKPYTVRNYTIVGNYKVGFPQWRVMKCHYPGEDFCVSDQKTEKPEKLIFSKLWS